MAKSASHLILVPGLVLRQKYLSVIVRTETEQVWLHLLRPNMYGFHAEIWIIF